MTQQEIEKKIFAGASLSEPRGFSDAFTDDEILELINDENYYDWSESFRDWLWSSVDRIINESLETLKETT
jgi:hypothetical protein